MAGKAITFATEQDWLEARPQYLTASEIARIYRPTGRPADIQACWALWEEKLGKRPKFTGNRYTAYGTDREEVIADWVEFMHPEHGLKLNSWRLWVCEEDTRFAATPDMISADRTVIGELKTVKATNEWAPRVEAIPRRYYLQVQWQLYCTGANSCLFVWEPYDDHNGELIGAGDFKSLLIEPDKPLIADMADFAEEWFALQHKTPPAPDVRSLVEQRRALDTQIAELEAKKKELTTQIAEELDGRVGTWDYPGVGKLTATAPMIRERFDTARFKKDNPDVAAGYTRLSTVAGQIRLTPEKEDA